MSRLTCLFVAAIVAASSLSGCRGGGDLIANPHTLMPSAAMIASVHPPAVPVPRELQKVALPAYFVQPGDALLLEPVDLTDVPRVAADQTIEPDGTIDLGVYGRPVVAGLTVEQIEVVVRNAICSLEPDACTPPDDLPSDPIERETIIEKFARGPVNVRLIGPESAVFYALGEVTAPGAYPLNGRETVLDAILKAGGLSDRADRCQIILARPTGPYECRVVLRVCYDRLVQLGDATTNYQILPGDRLFVASKTFCDSCSDIFCFWKPKGCEFCCDTGTCPCPCPSTGTAIQPPFVLPVGTPVSVVPAGHVDLPELLPAATAEPDAIQGTTLPDSTAGKKKGEGATPESERSRLPKLDPPAAKPDAVIGPPTEPPAIDLPRLD